MTNRINHAVWLLCGFAQLSSGQNVDQQNISSSPEKSNPGLPQAPVAVTAAPVATVVVSAPDEAAKARNSAAARTVVTSTTLNKYGDSHIGDALARVPGISFSNGSLQIRGLGGGYTQVLVDGAPPPRGFSLSSLSLSNVDRVEILRVPTAEFGTQAIGGTVNIVLKKIARPPTGRIRATAENTYRPAGSIDVQGSMTRGNLGVSMGVLGQVRKSQFSTPTTTDYIEYDSADQVVGKSTLVQSGESLLKSLTLTPRLQYKASDTVNFTSDLSASVTDVGTARTQDVSADGGTSTFLRDTTSDGDRRSYSVGASLSMSKRLPDGKIDTKIGLGRSTSDSKSSMVAPATTGALAFNRGDVRKTTGTSHDLSGKLSKRTLKNHQVVAGGSYSKTSSYFDALTADQVTGSGQRSEVFRESRSELKNFAFFAQDEWDLGNKSSVYLGLRWEHISVAGSTNNSAEQQYSSNVWSPIVQGLWRLDNKRAQMRLALSRTYKAPTALMLLTPPEQGLNNSPLLPSFRGNLKLKPELAWALEGAYEHSDPSGLNFNLRSYYRMIENLHRLEITKQNGLYETMYVGEGNGRTMGIDADISFPLKLVYDGAPNIDISLDASRVWSRVEAVPGPDNTLVPQSKSFGGSVDYTAESFPMTMGFSFRYGNGGWQRVSTDQRVRTDATRSVNTYAVWRVSKTSSYRMSILNMLKPRVSEISQLQLVGGRYDSITRGDSYRTFRLTFERKY